MCKYNNKTAIVSCVLNLGYFKKISSATKRSERPNNMSNALKKVKMRLW
jgi:hypothetical protein